MLEIYDNEYSSCSTKVRLVLHEKGVPWTRRGVDLTMFDHKTASYLKLNPNGVVPTAIVDGGEPLLESHIIIQYLDSAHDGPPLASRHAQGRARMQMWLKEIEELHLSTGIVNYDRLYLPYWRRLPKQDLESRIDRIAQPGHAQRMRYLIRDGLGAERVGAAERAVARFFERVDGFLAGAKWLSGEGFGLADVALTPYVDSRLHAISDLWYGKLRHIAAWLRRVRDRPSYAAAVPGRSRLPDFDAAIAAAPGGGGLRQL